MLDYLEWLEKASLSVTIRQSLWLYPTIEIIHLLGIVLLVGAAFMFDLRLLGFSGDLPVAGLAKHLLPWSRRGLILLIPSGLLLFATNARTLAFDPIFWLKMLLLVVAGLNVFVFHNFIFRNPDHYKNGRDLRLLSRMCAILSIVVWIAVIACGRLLAY